MRTVRAVGAAVFVAVVVVFGLGGVYIARSEASPGLPGVVVCPPDCDPLSLILGVPDVPVSSATTWQELMTAAAR